MFTQICTESREVCICDLNAIYINPEIGYPTDKYLEVLGKLKEFSVIEAQRLPRKTVITFTEQDGLRIEKPYREQFTVKQRFVLSCRWATVILTVVLLIAR